MFDRTSLNVQTANNLIITVNTLILYVRNNYVQLFASNNITLYQIRTRSNRIVQQVRLRYRLSRLIVNGN